MLGSWWIDFVERTKFIRSALQEKPRSYWISAFFFPQGFLTSILQMSARKIKVAVSSLGFSFAFRHHGEKEITDNIPTDGCLVHGIYSEACTVDFKTGLLREPGPSENDNEVPVIHFKPVQV